MCNVLGCEGVRVERDREIWGLADLLRTPITADLHIFRIFAQFKFRPPRLDLGRGERAIISVCMNG